MSVSLLLHFQSTSTYNTGDLLRMQCSIIQALVQLCEFNRPNVRANAVKLLYLLADECDEAIILEHMEECCIKTLLKIIKTSNDDEEVASSVGLIFLSWDIGRTMAMR